MAKPLESGALSAFFEGLSMMLAAGIQTDEAVGLLGEDMRPGSFRDACEDVYRMLVEGVALSQAMRITGMFPDHAVSAVLAGESSGRLETVLRSLAVYYNEESRLSAKVHASVVYPVALLGVMAVILALTVAVVLPVFASVYESFSGGVASGAFFYVNVAVVVGWVAFALVTLAFVGMLALAAMNSNESGRRKTMVLFAKFPITRDAMYRHAVSRFTTLLSTYVAAGFDANEAMHRVMGSVDNAELRKRASAAYAAMLDPNLPLSLSQAVAQAGVYEPVYARMLTVGARSGSDDRVLRRLADIYFEDALTLMDAVLDRVEPALAAVLTIGVGAALVTVMLPLIGIMGSIG